MARRISGPVERAESNPLRITQRRLIRTHGRIITVNACKYASRRGCYEFKCHRGFIARIWAVTGHILADVPLEPIDRPLDPILVGVYGSHCFKCFGWNRLCGDDEPDDVANGGV